MRRLLPVVVFSVVATATLAEPDPALVATDRAEEALAAGRPAEAVRVLSAALPRLEGADADRVRCLLGHAWEVQGDAARAERVLAEVPRDAECGLRAAWLRVTALESSGRAEEAAALAEELAATPLGADRDGASARSLEQLADRLLQDPERGTAQALALLRIAAGMRVSDPRAGALARKAFDLVELPGVADWTCDGLTRGLTAAEDPELRERAAIACGAWGGRLIATGIEDPHLRAWIGAWWAADDPATLDTLRTRALEAGRPEWRTITAEDLARRLRLDAVPLLDGSGAEDEATGLRLWALTGRWAEVVRRSDAWLEAHPRGRERGEVEEQRAAAVLAMAREAERAGRHQDALAAYDELLARHPASTDAAVASWEAGVVARAAGRPEEATHRWEETRARYPAAPDRAGVSLARQRLLDQGDLPGAEALLRGWDTPEARGELDRLHRPALHLWSDGGAAREPVVHLRTRGLDRVELRLHPIDAEAFVAAGGAPDTLGTLDVAAIAPERTWSVEVPNPRPGVDVAFDAPVRVPRPGLYAVTAASDVEEARVLLSVGALHAVTRVVGGDVAVAAFDEAGRAVPGARVLLVGQQRVDGRTDGSGLFIHHADAPDDEVVLVEKGGRVALAPLHRDGSSSPSMRVSAEVDRAVYLPGDHVGVRIVAHDDHGPVAGGSVLWLERAGTALGSVSAASDEDGVVWADLRVPDGIDGGSLTVMASIAGHDPRSVAEVRVAPRDPSGTALVAEMDGSSLVARVTGSGGGPLAGVPVVVADRVVATDLHGEARFEGPRADLPWEAMATVPGRRLRATARRTLPDLEPLELDLVQDRLRPGEPAEVRFVGSGELELAVTRAVDRPTTEPLVDPWLPDPPVGLEDVDGRGPDRAAVAAEELVSRRALAGGGEGSVALDPLPVGRYTVTLTRAEGGTRSVSASLEVAADGLRLVGARDTGAGAVLSLTPEGGPALLTAETDHLLFAAVRPAGHTAVATPDAAWAGEVEVVATGPGGELHARTVEADPDPRVTLRAVPAGTGADLVVEVRDAAGRPLDADVALAAWDLRSVGVVGEASSMGSADLRAQRWGSGVSAWAGALIDGAAGEPVAAALLAEVELRQDRDKARRAGADGLFSDNALAGLLQGELPVSETLALEAASSGYGSGGGGFGEGGLGTRGEGGIRSGWDPGVPGVRERVLWTRVRSVGGRATVHLDGPPADWRVRATAVSRTGIGVARAEIDLRERVWLVPVEPGAGSPQDAAHPTVVVVNGTDRVLEDRLQLGEASRAIRVEPRSASTFVADEARKPGSAALPVALGAVRAEWRFPLAEGDPDPAGALWVTAGRGPAALARIATRPGDAPRDAWWWAQAGRAAVAAWVAGADPALEDRIRDARDQLRLLSPTEGRELAARALFLVEADRAGALQLADVELAHALDAVVPAGPREDLTWAARALVAGGRELDPALASVVDLAAPTTLPEAPPPVGDPALVDWLRAAAARVKGVPSAGALAVSTTEPPAADLRWRATGLVGGEEPTVARRFPVGPDGDPVVGWSVRGPGCDPCVLRVGDRLDAPGRRGSVLGEGDAGVARVRGTYVLGGRATSDGRYAPLRVEVIEEGLPSPTDASTHLAAAAAWREAGVPTDVPESTDRALAEATAKERFAQALLAGREQTVAETFRVLLATSPDARVLLSEVAAAARALRATGDSRTAIRAWRAAVDTAFVSEVAAIRAVEGPVGLLVALRGTRDAALRQPDGPAVGDALYVLPGRLLDAADQGLPAEVVQAGVTPTDARLTAAAWDRSFLATHRDHPLATAAGLRLGRTLLELHAPLPAHEWATRVAAAHPGDPLQDALTYLDAAALTEAGSADRAEPLLRRLAEQPFPDASGVPVPSPYATDARLALGRLEEARGDYDAALAIYRDLSTDEAQQAAEVLTTRELVAPSLVRLAPGDPATIDVTLRGLDHLSLRAYRVDLRTVFLRDGGLDGLGAIRVDGVSPAWSDTRPVTSGPFPESRRLTLPLSGSGAWLVQLDGEDVHASTVVVRSGLRLAVDDHGGSRRIDLRRGERAVQGAEVRALDGGSVVAALTDVRGVAEVPLGAPVLAWSGDELAFTDPQGEVVPVYDARPAQGRSGALDGLDRQIDDQRQLDEDRWEDTVRGASEALSLRKL